MEVFVFIKEDEKGYIKGIIFNVDYVRRYKEREVKKFNIYKINIFNFRGIYIFVDVIFVELKRFRLTEIQQFKRRFGGKNGYCEIKENFVYKVEFKLIDFDWVGSLGFIRGFRCWVFEIFLFYVMRMKLILF